MVLFVLYFEPLIRTIHGSAGGFLVFGKFLKVMHMLMTLIYLLIARKNLI